MNTYPTPPSSSTINNNITAQDLINSIDSKNYTLTTFLFNTLSQNNPETLKNTLLSTDINNWTPLHWSIHRRAPLPLLRQLISLSPPPTLHHRDNDGMTPLHLAIKTFPSDDNSDNSDNRVSLLVQLLSSPEICATGDDQGYTPLHQAISMGRSSLVIRNLIAIHPAAVCHVDNFGDSPVDLFVREWNGGVREMFEGNDDILIRGRYGGRKGVGWVYDVMAYLLRCTFKVREDLPTLNVKRVVYEALVFRKCPWSFWRLMLKVQPNEVSDGWLNGGEYLLHEAVRRLGEESWDGECYKCVGCQKVFGSGWWYEHRNRSYDQFCAGCFKNGNNSFIVGDGDDYKIVYPIKKMTRVIHDIVAFNATIASIPSCDERLPLHVAIDNGGDFNDDEGLAAINDAAPRSLSTRDLKSHMYPYMMALAHDKGRAAAMEDDDVEWDEGGYLSHFGSCFALLVASSHLVRVFEDDTTTNDVFEDAPMDEIMMNSENLPALTNISPIPSPVRKMKTTIAQGPRLSLEARYGQKLCPSNIPTPSTTSQPATPEIQTPSLPNFSSQNKSLASSSRRASHIPKASFSAGQSRHSYDTPQSLPLSTTRRRRRQTTIPKAPHLSLESRHGRRSYSTTIFGSSPDAPPPTVRSLFPLSKCRMDLSEKKQKTMTLAESVLAYEQKGFRSGGKEEEHEYIKGPTEVKPFKFGISHRPRVVAADDGTTLAESILSYERKGYRDDKTPEYIPTATQVKPFNLSKSKSEPHHRDKILTLAESMSQFESMGCRRNLGMDFSSTSTPRGSTQPQPFSLSTSKKPKVASEVELTLAEKLKDYETKGFRYDDGRWKDMWAPTTTEVVPFKLTPSLPSTGVKPAEKTLAERLDEYNKKGLRSSQPPSATTFTKSVTRPKSPPLSKSNRKSMCKTPVEREEEMLEYMKSHQFKAKPIKKGVLKEEEAKVNEKTPTKVTMPTREEMDAEECKKQFRARPMPNMTHRPSIANTPSKRPSTTPRPFRLSKRQSPSPKPSIDDVELAKKFRARPAPVSSSASSPLMDDKMRQKLETLKKRMADRVKRPWLNKTVLKVDETCSINSSQTHSTSSTITIPEPFNLQTETRGSKHKQILKQKLKNERRSRHRQSLYKALPLPVSSPPPPPPPSSTPPTKPEPFLLSSVEKHAAHQLSLAQKIKQEETLRHQSFQFHRPSPPSLRSSPPIKLPSRNGRRPVTPDKPFHLVSETRVVARLAFDESCRLEREGRERARREREEMERVEGEREVRRLRRMTASEGGFIPDVGRGSKRGRGGVGVRDVDDLISQFGTVRLR